VSLRRISLVFPHPFPLPQRILSRCLYLEGGRGDVIDNSVGTSTILPLPPIELTTAAEYVAGEGWGEGERVITPDDTDAPVKYYARGKFVQQQLIAPACAGK